MKPLPMILRFGIGDAGELAEEFLRCIHADHIQSQTLVVVEHVAELVFAQHSVVHEDAGEVAAYGAVEKHGCH